MNTKTLWLTATALSLSLLHAAGQQLPDQSQLVCNAGMSARTMPQYTIFQTFTAGITGTLSQINIGFFDSINGKGTLNIYRGAGLTGTLLQTQTVTVVCPANVLATVSFATSAPVTTGQSYTFQFIPAAGIPDPYGVQVENPGTYGGGYMGITDPSGTTNTGFDMVFETFVTPAALAKDDISLSLAPAGDMLLLKWVAAYENNTLFYNVEQSLDGQHFADAGTVVASAVQPASNVKYSYRAAFLNGENYYRITQVNKNGYVKMSAVLRYFSANTQSPGFTIFPNPATSGGPVMLAVSNLQAPYVFVTVYTENGRAVYKKTMPVSGGYAMLTLQQAFLPAGAYFVTTSDGKQYGETKKLIISQAFH